MKRIVGAVLLISACNALHAGKKEQSVPTKKKALSARKNTLLQGHSESIWYVLLGCGDDNQEWYKQGTSNLKEEKKELYKYSFSELNIDSGFAQRLLKILVVRGESELLPHFLSMYQRSFPDDSNGINFAFEMRMSDSDTTLKYTLLDVAHAAFKKAELEKQDLTDSTKVINTLKGFGAHTQEKYALIPSCNKAHGKPVTN